MPFTVPEKAWRELLTVSVEKLVIVQKFGPLALCVLALPVKLTLTFVLLTTTPCRLPPPFRLIANVNGVAPGRSVAALPTVSCVELRRAVPVAVPAEEVLQVRAVSL